MVLVLDHHRHHLGVVQHPQDLLGGGGRVDRHRLGPDGPEREVEERPLVARTGHQRDPVAEPHPVRDQSSGQGQHLIAELPGGHITPLATGVLAAERDVVRIVLRVVEDHIGETADLRCHAAWVGQ